MTPEPMTVAGAGRALVIQTCLLAGNGPPTSVLICDDRPGVLHGLTRMLRPLPTLVDIDWVPDGFALLDTLAVRAAGLVLIGIHSGNTTGAEAVSLSLAMHPSTEIIVFGSLPDLDILAQAFARGARGLLLWEPDEPPDPRTAGVA